MHGIFLALLEKPLKTGQLTALRLIHVLAQVTDRLFIIPLDISEVRVPFLLCQPALNKAVVVLVKYALGHRLQFFFHVHVLHPHVLI